jgi:hypothetical protein
MDTQMTPVTLGRHFTITPAGLTVLGKPTFGECEQLWEALLTLEKSIQFSIGDAMKLFRELWGERAAQIISDRVGWTLETLRAYEWTAEKVAPENRVMDRLTYSHHQVVARLSPPEQKAWLAKASEPINDGGSPWTVGRLKTAIKAGADPEPSRFYVMVTCVDEPARDALIQRLEREGYRCKSLERREPKGAAA